MSHEIEMRDMGNGVTGSFVASREAAWHGLGIVADRDLTVAEALDLLDVGEIVKLPIYGAPTGPDGFPMEVSFGDRMGTFRIRNGGAEVTPLGIVGNDYPVWGEREGFSFLQDIVAESGAVVSAAGLMKDGKRSFCCLRLPSTVQVGGFDNVDEFIFCQTSHDGSVSYVAATTMIRTVCHNTVNFALQGAARKYTVKHTKNATLRVDEARKTLEIAEGYAGAFAAYAEQMLAKKVTTDRFEEIVRRAWGQEADRPGATARAKTTFKGLLDTSMDLWTGSGEKGAIGTNASITGTAWGAYNVMTEVLDWYGKVRIPGTAQDSDRAQARRLERNLSGDNADAKIKAQKIVMAMA